MIFLKEKRVPKLVTNLHPSEVNKTGKQCLLIEDCTFTSSQFAERASIEIHANEKPKLSKMFMLESDRSGLLNDVQKIEKLQTKIKS